MQRRNFVMNSVTGFLGVLSGLFTPSKKSDANLPPIKSINGVTPPPDGTLAWSHLPPPTPRPLSPLRSLYYSATFSTPEGNIARFAISHHASAEAFKQGDQVESVSLDLTVETPYGYYLWRGKGDDYISYDLCAETQEEHDELIRLFWQLREWADNMLYPDLRDHNDGLLLAQFNTNAHQVATTVRCALAECQMYHPEFVRNSAVTAGQKVSTSIDWPDESRPHDTALWEYMEKYPHGHAAMSVAEG